MIDSQVDSIFSFTASQLQDDYVSVMKIVFVPFALQLKVRQ
jgi:hypothetical protein